jgi:hypothetical protein
MFRNPGNPISAEQELVPAGLIPDFHQLPLHHPSDLKPEDPEFHRRPTHKLLLARQFEIDYQAPRCGLFSIYQVIKAFRNDMLQLKAGYLSVDPVNHSHDACLKTYASNMAKIDKEIIAILVDIYEQLFETAEFVTTLTPGMIQQIQRQTRENEVHEAAAQGAAE